MKIKHKDFIIMGLLLAVAAFFSLSIYFKDFKETDTVLIKDFPQTVGDWSSEDIPLSPNDLAVLETDNVFVRKYTNPQGEEVYLYIVYTQTNHKALHPPEICYTGGGISILEKSHDLIPVNYKNMTISANKLLLESNNMYQTSYYWFKVGDTFTSSYWKQQAHVAFNTLLGKRQGSALIRISAAMIDKHQGTAVKEIKDFTDLIVPLLFKYLP